MKKLMFLVSFSIASASVWGICDNFGENIRSERSGSSGHNLRNIKRVCYVPAPGTGFSQFQEKDDPKDLDFTLSSLGTDRDQSQLSEQGCLQQEDSILSYENLFSDCSVREEINLSQIDQQTLVTLPLVTKRKHYQSNEKFFQIEGKQQYNSDDEDCILSDTNNKDLYQNQSHPPKKKPCLDNNLAIRMWKFPNVKIFSYKYEGIENVPSKVWNFKWLKSLNLGKINMANLPDEIENLANSKAKDICVNHTNKTTELPKEIGNLINLEILDLSNNAIETLPEDITKLTKLRELTLVGNFFYGIWPAVIERLPNLEKLTLDEIQETLWEKHLHKLKKNKNFSVCSSH
ncbi:MAG: leucine-rich repeat domain-containing protein [Alphaproteobacteria bacterium]|nr:leucine-rich repeat domain-containing protein [Alphaproteobacteria bacterium]